MKRESFWVLKSFVGLRRILHGLRLLDRLGEFSFELSRILSRVPGFHRFSIFDVALAWSSIPALFLSRLVLFGDRIGYLYPTKVLNDSKQAPSKSDCSVN